MERGIHCCALFCSNTLFLFNISKLSWSTRYKFYHSVILSPFWVTLP